MRGFPQVQGGAGNMIPSMLESSGSAPSLGNSIQQYSAGPWAVLLSPKAVNSLMQDYRI